jgi:hypothetical protein
MMEYKHFFTLLEMYLPPGELKNNQLFRTWLKEYGKEVIYKLSDYQMFALPYPRVDWYKKTDFFEIQEGVTQYANGLISDLGFYSIKLDLDLLGDLEIFSRAIMFLSLVFDIVIMLFVVLSILLIYSLLMISVESKTFEFGVMRMQGLSNSGIVSMVIIQAMMFVAPAVFFGFALAMFNIGTINNLLFKDMETSPVPSSFAVGQAIFIGLVIPLLSSISPIQAALGKNLNDSLDITRSKSKAVMIDIIDPKKTNLASYVSFGTIAVLYGMSIYYFLPLSLLSFNFGMVLKIFFAILVGMLLGLSMLAFNLQRFVEIALTHILLFFEKKSMKMLVLTNLNAHRSRNKMTSIIYSISLGFIIFLIVSLNLEMKTIELMSLQYEGSYLVLKTDNQDVLKAAQFDKIIMENRDVIEEYSYITMSA